MKKLAVAITTTFLLTSTPTLAEVYIGAKAGKSWLNEACLSGQDCNNDDVTVGAFVGYEMWDFLSIEAGYDYLGKFKSAGLEDDKVAAITLAPKVNLPLTDAISLYGKFGAAFVDYGNKDDYSYLGAAGVEFMSTGNIAVRLEYQYISDINNDIVRASGNSATLGVVYKFGGTEESAPMVIVEEKPEIKVVEEKVEPELKVVEKPEPIVITKTFKAEKLNSDSFKSGSTELTEESKQDLTRLVDILNTYPETKIKITGHTDSTGSASYNQIVSEQRAKAVADELEKQGVNASQLLIDGQGESSPIASNSTKAGREQNRRVEISIPEFDYKLSK